MSLIDTAMVGRLGNAALASVGVGNFMFILVISVLFGINAGVQALVARRIGEDKPQLAGLDLNAGLVVSMGAGLVLTFVAYFALPPLFHAVSDDPQVIQKGIAYLTPRIPSTVLVGCNVAFMAYWNGVSLPKLSLLTVLIATAVNIIANYLLIFGNLGLPRLETLGAGLGTTIATFAASVANIFLGVKHAKKNGFLKGLPDKKRVKTLIQISMPESIRNVLSFAGLMAVFAIVSLLGTLELAAYNVILNIMLVAILPAHGMGVTAITLVGQALGRKEPLDAKNWGWEVAQTGSGVLILFSIVVFIFPGQIISLFIPDPETVAVAILPLRILAASIWLEAFGRIISFALIGAGATKIVMVWTLGTQWILALPLTWLVAVYLGYSLAGVFVVSMATIALRTVAFSILWHREGWRAIAI